MKRKLVFGILAVLIFAAIFIGWKFFGPAVRTPSGEFFYIKTGSDYATVKKELTQQKFLDAGAWFDYTSRMLKYKQVKPGRYKLQKGMSVVNLVRMLRNGNQAPLNFVITRIRTKEALAGRVGRMFECDSLQMIRFMNSADSLRSFGFDSNTVMAAVMPLTYTMKWNTTAGRIFRQWNNAYQQFWTDERRQKAKNLGLTAIEATTLASIIEEETNKASDKPNIASVYLNRINQGMPLQADPTVKFALKNFELRRILRGHTQTISPYNTYVNKGLPPGPICTPSLESIEAVLNTPQTSYLYFVANSNFDGSHIFTSNYEDHMKYARLYQSELTELMKKKDSIKNAGQTK
ncbi:MAG TPA: endolytic transglycosylase MltG [Chitinophagaceae bacterium]